MNDRYLYFPMLGGAGLAAQGCVLLVRRGGVTYRRCVVATLCMVLLLLPLLSYSRAAVWKDSLTLWSAADTASPGNPDVLFALGETHHKAGNREMAEADYIRSLARDPFHRRALHNISNLYLEANSPEKATPYLLRLVGAYPRYGEGFLALGHYHVLCGNPAEAETAIRTAVHLEPGSGLAMSYLGNVALVGSDYASARQHYDKALSLGFDSAEMRYNMARIEAARGNEAAVLRNLETAFLLGFRDFDTVMGNSSFSALRCKKELAALVDRYTSRKR